MLDSFYISIGNYLTNPTDLKDISIVFATIMGVPFLIWRYFSIHKTANAQVEQAKIAEQQHITDRIAKAFKLIANDDVNDAIGAIYSLERIANDSPRDQQSIMQYLADYVRRKVPNQSAQLADEDSSKYKIDTDKSDSTSTDNLQLTRNINAALNVLGKNYLTSKHRKFSIKKGFFKLIDIYRIRNRSIAKSIDSTLKIANENISYRINLSNTDLSGKNFEGFDLNNVDLRNSNLSKVNLSSANLESADLRNANLDNANLRMANLQRADLKDASCNAATFINAHLENANLWNGSFEMAIMIKARLNRAIFINAKMKGINLIDADIQGAIFSESDLQFAHLDPGYKEKGVFLGAKL